MAAPSKGSACVPGLEEALAAAGLEGHVAKAAEWCEQMGPRDLEEIAEEDVYADFAEALGLRPLEKRRLRKGLPGGGGPSPVPASGGGGGYASAASLPKAPQDMAGPSAVLQSTGQKVFVKNTFLDLDQGAGAGELRRAQTVGTGYELKGIAEDEPAGPEQPAEQETIREEGEGESMAVPAGLYKTVTCDGYEDMNEWRWVAAGGDPNHGAPPPAEYESEEPQGELAAEPSYAELGAAPQMVGMVMVPADPSGAVPYSAPSMCFPGCVAVPLDRFARWPGDMVQAQMLGADGYPMPYAEDGAAAAAPSAAAAEGPKRAAVLQRAFSVASSIYRVRWTVDARKLQSTDREHVSPPFDLSCGGPCQFKMIMRPRVVSDEKGGASFKKAKGRGYIELRCLSDVDPAQRPVVTFRIAIGSGSGKAEAPRGPVRNDFAERPICGLPDGRQMWDFSRAVDKTTQTFVVCLEVLAGSG